MNRRRLLQTLGAAGAATIFPFGRSKTGNAAIAKLKTNALLADDGCILIPQETAGPYPWPSDGKTLSTDATFYRQDITEGLSGLPLSVTLNVVNINDNCNPVANANVVIWHCDKDGNYSEFGNSTGKTFCRGIQMTDANGQVMFKTIYPGWYPGRVQHIHFQVFLNSVLSATSQLAFPEDINTAVNNSSLYSSRGQNSTKNTNDGVFSDSTNTQYEIATITGDTTQGFTASLNIGIDTPKSGVINLEPETGGQFKLVQNYPNPFSSETTIPFSLTNDSDVTIEVFDLQGKKVLEVLGKKMSAGQAQVSLSKENGRNILSRGNYIYQIVVTNSNGTYRKCRSLTVM